MNKTKYVIMVVLSIIMIASSANAAPKKVKVVVKPTVVATPVATSGTASSLSPTSAIKPGDAKSLSLTAKSISSTVSPTAKSMSSTAKAASSSVSGTAKKSAVAEYLIGFFTPSDVSATAADHLQVSYGIRAFNGTNSSGQPAGFQTSSSDETGVSDDLAVMAKIWRIGIEYRPLGHRSEHETTFYGSSLNGLGITTSNVIVGKFFAYDTCDWLAYVGGGAEETSIDGAISMGGFKFITEGDGWSPVLQFGAGYRLNKHWTIDMVYERSNIKIVTHIPGVPDLITTRNDRVIARVSLGLF
jgi:Outer membrane protein beta-barrel domain